MNYTKSDSYVKHPETDRPMHSDTSPIPTVWSANDANAIIWSLVDVVTAAGLVPQDFNPGQSYTYKLVTYAIKKLAKAQVDAAFKGHTHSTADIAGIGALIEAALEDHTHSTADIEGIGALIEAYIPVRHSHSDNTFFGMENAAYENKGGSVIGIGDNVLYKNKKPHVCAIGSWTGTDNAYSNVIMIGMNVKATGNFQCRLGDSKTSRHRYGLIAQEVGKITEDNGISFAGYQDHSVNGGEQQQTLDYTQFIAPLIKAVQELSARNDEVQAQLDALQNSVNSKL